MNVRPRRIASLAAVMAAAVVCGTAHARVVELKIDERVPVLEGVHFGDSGPYEKISGTVRFSFDPDNDANRRVTDLSRAPVGESGGVEARANFMVLRPTEPHRTRGIGYLEVSNRGGKASLPYFNNGRRGAPDPMTAEDFGDGLLMRLGLTVIWVGWQFDVGPEPQALRLDVPTAAAADGPVTGLVRSDWVVDEPQAALHLGHRGHRPYAVFDPQDDRNILYVRTGRDHPRRVVPRNRWRFSGGPELADDRHSGWITLDGGFQPGRIYELVYVGRDPALVGLGLAAVRDMMAYARYDASSPFSVSHGIAFGVSQTGRFLRHFLFQGFNRDEQDRKVFDGLLIHTAGAGRGSFNHRFAQPSRDAHRFSAFVYPTDLYPFTSLPTRDPVSDVEEGLLDSLPQEFRPRVMVTNTGYEYWGRAASLVHTTPDGARDADLPDNERIYHIASAQHYVGRWPPREDRRLPGADGWRGNPVDLLVNLRALLSRLADWVADDRPPPQSSYPRVDHGELVDAGELGFPAIPGIVPPHRPHLAYRADYGPRWGGGIVSRQPPWLGPPFATRVPALDEFGNEIGGIRNVEVRVPLATFTPWSLRAGMPVPDEMHDFTGLLLPLPGTRAEADGRGDARPPVEELYENRDAYLAAVGAAAAELVGEGYLLAEDRPRVERRALEMWDRLVAGKGGGR